VTRVWKQNLSWILPSVSERSALFLKVLALALMVMDHVHFVFFERSVEPLYWLPRLVFPLYALLIAQHLERHQADPRRYILRLCLYGAIAQPAYMLCFGQPQLNVLFTLALSVGVWWVLKNLKARGWESAWRYALVGFVAVCFVNLEFWFAGVLAVPVFAALMRRGSWSDWLLVPPLAWGIVGFGAPWIMPILAITVWVVLARESPVSSNRSKPNGWMKHLFYMAYPLHLTIIALIALVQ
jgi:TraX protein